MVLLEAMAAGVPVVCTDCGGGREVVEGVGKVFPLGDSAALATELVAAAQPDVGSAPPAVTALLHLTEGFSDARAQRDFNAILSKGFFHG